MMKIAFVWANFLDPQTKEFIPGGVQTYILNLGRLCQEQKWVPVVFQSSDRYFETVFEGIRVIGIDTRKIPTKRRRRVLYHGALRCIDLGEDILIFAGDLWSVPCQHPRVLSIQHGVFWDLPLDLLQVLPTRFSQPLEKLILNRGWGAWLKRMVIARRALRMFENCSNRVCSDYNFLNWYRTVSTGNHFGDIWIIPNFVCFKIPDIAERSESREGKIRILFARRFTRYRGTRLITEVANEILSIYPNVIFTFAGEGPEEAYLRSNFAGEDRVRFIKYLPDESLKIHLEHDISVVPSIGSESICLSVVEAMAAGCAPVATNVGGITNIILDGYNGLLVMPNASALTCAIERLIVDQNLRRSISLKAVETAREVFSLERWKTQWIEVLKELAER